MSDVVDQAERRFAVITDEAVEQLRRLIGVPIVDTVEPWCYEATRDNIRHYAHGIGDANPLWSDPDYAAGTAYGTVIAPPSFVFALDRVLSGYVGGLPGIHAMWAGADLTWHAPIVRETKIVHVGPPRRPRRARDPLRRAGDPADLPRRHRGVRRHALCSAASRGASAPSATRRGRRARSTRRPSSVPADACTRRSSCRRSTRCTRPRRSAAPSPATPRTSRWATSCRRWPRGR